MNFCDAILRFQELQARCELLGIRMEFIPESAGMICLTCPDGYRIQDDCPSVIGTFLDGYESCRNYLLARA